MPNLADQLQKKQAADAATAKADIAKARVKYNAMVLRNNAPRPSDPERLAALLPIIGKTAPDFAADTAAVNEYRQQQELAAAEAEMNEASATAQAAATDAEDTLQSETRRLQQVVADTTEDAAKADRRWQRARQAGRTLRQTEAALAERGITLETS